MITMSAAMMAMRWSRGRCHTPYAGKRTRVARDLLRTRRRETPMWLMTTRGFYSVMQCFDDPTREK